MKNIYSVKPALLIDNNKSKYNNKIKPVSFLKNIEGKEGYVVLLASTNPYIYKSLKEELLNYFSSDKIFELESMKKFENELFISNIPKVGKYSYGPLCQNPYVESIGNFCSFALGTDVVENHPTDYITTHPMIYKDKINFQGWDYYVNYDKSDWYFERVKPQKLNIKMKKSKIANDVWLGKNVIITNPELFTAVD